MKTSELLERLRAHYRKPGEARDGEVLITEAAAPVSERRADLVRIGLWRSRGPGIDVHELKVSRADWLRELDDPAKAEAWWPYCHRFWIVAPSTDIVDPTTLPEGWGLMVPGRGRRFTVVTRATTKEPKVTTALLVELIRRTDNSRLAENDRAIADVQERLRQQYQERAEKTAVETLDLEVRHRLVLLEQLEGALGVTLDRWIYSRRDGVATPEQLGEALRDVVADHLAAQRLRKHVDDQIDHLERTAESVAGAVKRLRVPAVPA